MKLLSPFQLIDRVAQAVVNRIVWATMRATGRDKDQVVRGVLLLCGVLAAWNGGLAWARGWSIRWAVLGVACAVGSVLVALIPIEDWNQVRAVTRLRWGYWTAEALDVVGAICGGMSLFRAAGMLNGLASLFMFYAMATPPSAPDRKSVLWRTAEARGS